SGTPLRPRTPVAQTRTHPRPRRLHRCPSTSRNRPRHPWQLSTRRPTVHPNGTHHENQRTTHHHRRRCRSSTINPGHRHLKPPSGAAKSHRVLHRRAAAVHEPGLEDEDEVGPPGEDDHWYARCREG